MCYGEVMYEYEMFELGILYFMDCFAIAYQHMTHGMSYSENMNIKCLRNMKIFYVYDTLCARKVGLDFQQSISAYGLTHLKTRIFGRFEYFLGYPDFEVKTSLRTWICYGGVTYRVRNK